MRFLFISVAVSGIRGRTPQSTRTLCPPSRAPGAYFTLERRRERARAPSLRGPVQIVSGQRTRVTTGRGPGLYHVGPCTVSGQVHPPPAPPVSRVSSVCLALGECDRVWRRRVSRHVCAWAWTAVPGRATRWAVAVREERAHIYMRPL